MAGKDVEKGRRSKGQRMLDEEDATHGEGERILHEENTARREAEQRSLGSLVSELTNEVSTLFRDEVDLVKTEGSQKLAKAKTGILAIAIGSILALAGLVVLLFAAVYGLAEVMHIGWAALIVAVVTLVIAGIAAMSGMSSLKPENLTPERSMNSLREDADIAKEKTHGSK